MYSSGPGLYKHSWQLNQKDEECRDFSCFWDTRRSYCTQCFLMLCEVHINCQQVEWHHHQSPHYCFDFLTVSLIFGLCLLIPESIFNNSVDCIIKLYTTYQNLANDIGTIFLISDGYHKGKCQCFSMILQFRLI